MGRIINWINSEEIFVFVEEECIADIERIFPNKNVGWISGDMELYIVLNNCGYNFQYEGDINDYCTGDIVSVSTNGSFRIIHDCNSSEVDMFITNRCNSNCIMCPLPEVVRRKNDGFNIEFLKQYIQLLPDDIGYINVTGGEPTIEKDGFFEIMRTLKQKFMQSDFQLLTNGRSLADTSFLIKVIEASPTGIRFAVPVHSSNSEVHDYITRASGSFEQTDRGIKNLLMHNQKVEIRIVVSSLNMDYLTETAKYISDRYKGCFCVNYIAMEMMGNAAANKDILWVDYSDVFKVIKPGIDHLVRNGIDVQLYNFPLCDVDRGYWHIAAKSITDYKIRYMEECNDCMVKEICGGFFRSTKQIIHPKVKPVRQANEA